MAQDVDNFAKFFYSGRKKDGILNAKQRDSFVEAFNRLAAASVNDKGQHIFKTRQDGKVLVDRDGNEVKHSVILKQEEQREFEILSRDVIDEAFKIKDQYALKRTFTQQLAGVAWGNISDINSFNKAFEELTKVKRTRELFNKADEVNKRYMASAYEKLERWFEGYARKQSERLQRIVDDYVALRQQRRIDGNYRTALAERGGSGEKGHLGYGVSSVDDTIIKYFDDMVEARRKFNEDTDFYKKTQFIAGNQVFRAISNERLNGRSEKTKADITKLAVERFGGKVLGNNRYEFTTAVMRDKFIEKANDFVKTKREVESQQRHILKPFVNLKDDTNTNHSKQGGFSFAHKLADTLAEKIGFKQKCRRA